MAEFSLSAWAKYMNRLAAPALPALPKKTARRCQAELLTCQHKHQRSYSILTPELDDGRPSPVARLIAAKT